jgi:CBS domain-containing protein
MKVGDVMTNSPASCSPETNLAAAVEILWNRNCGVLPIVDSNAKLVGVVTDRDICVALGTRNQLPSEITVREVASGKVVAGRPDDDLRKALAIMAEAKVRRLPIVDAAGKLQGILSIADILLRTGMERSAEFPAEDVVKTLKIVHTLQGKRQQIAAVA